MLKRPKDRVTNVLVVDDNRRAAEVVERMLELPGFKTRVAAGGLEALEWFSAHSDQVDLVILDQSMPDLLGEDLAEKLWALRPELPIFLMTGSSADEINRLIQSHRFIGVLKKPFQGWELQLRLQSVLGI